MKKVVMQNEILLTEVQRLVAEGESVTLKAKGTSMLPFIRGERDNVVLVKPGHIRLYDIVLARVSTGNIVLHRVIAVDGDILTLMGDGNIRGCEKCRINDVMAKVAAIDKGGRVLDCTNVSHIRKVRLWVALKPVRRYLLAIYRRLFK